MTQKTLIKRKLKFQNDKDCLEAAQIVNKINYFKKVTFMQIVLKNS